MTLNDEVHHGIEERVTGGDEGGGWLADLANPVLVERDAFVGLEDGGAATDEAIPMPDVGGDVPDFVAMGLAPMDGAAE